MRLEFYNNYIPDKLYLDKKLESKSLKKVLDSGHLTAYRLYIISNGQKEAIQLYDESFDNLHLRFYVKLNWAFAAEARRQVFNIKEWKQLVRIKPSWELVVYLEKNHKELYKFKHRVTKIDHLHNCIREQKMLIEDLIVDETKLNQAV